MGVGGCSHFRSFDRSLTHSLTSNQPPGTARMQALLSEIPASITIEPLSTWMMRRLSDTDEPEGVLKGKKAPSSSLVSFTSCAEERVVLGAG